MSQLRDIGVSLRAAFAVVAVWALMFSMSASSAAAVGASDAGASVQVQNGGLFACFKRHMTQRADATGKAPDGRHAGRHHCPHCLAAHTAAAVLPDRLSTPAELLRAPPQRVAPPATTARQPESVALRSAHGARAPPFPI
jgi:Protein of unknown function (DUF2946)